jgi:cell wall-associated NlpC family hydrolase
MGHVNTWGKPMTSARRSSTVLRLLVLIAALALLAPTVAYAAVPQAGFGQSLAPGGSWGMISPPPPAMQFSGTTDFTIEAWVKPTPGGGGGVIYFTPGFFGLFQTWLSVASDNTVHFLVGYHSWTWEGVATTTAIPTDRWTHVAAVRSGAVITIYIDGVSAASTIVSASMFAAPNYREIYLLGTSPGDDFKGSVDELRLWNTALAPGTIDAWRYRSPDPSHPGWANLLSWWPFEEGTGAALVDAKGVGSAVIGGSGQTWSLSTVSLEQICDEDTSVSGQLAHYDADGGALATTVSRQPAHGVVTMDDTATAAFTYTPAANFNGADTFEYVVSDGVNVSAPAAVNVTVRPMPDAPVAGAVTYQTIVGNALTEAAPGMLSASSDADGDAITVNTISAAPNGTLVVMPDGSFTYTPNPGFVGTENVILTVSDGSLTSSPATISFEVLADTMTLPLTSVSATLGSLGDSYVVAGSLRGTNGALADARVVLMSSPTDGGYAPAGMETTTAADGTFAFTVTPSAKTYYRVSYAGDATHLSGTSDPICVTPAAWVSTPLSPARAKSNTAFMVVGTMKPTHPAGTGVVRVYYWKAGPGIQTSVFSPATGYVDAVLSASGSASFYTAALQLPSGDWHLRAQAPADAEHAMAWSSGFVSVSTRTTEERVVEIARSLIGKKFRWGAAGPNRFDASGFTRYVFAQAGISLPRTAKAQLAAGPRIALKNLRPGDLVFSYAPTRHVGIYIGNGKMIDCNRPGGSVQVRRIYWSHYKGATRPTAR